MKSHGQPEIKAPPLFQSFSAMYMTLLPAPLFFAEVFHDFKVFLMV